MDRQHGAEWVRAMVGRVNRLGAAAFALGLSLAVPQAVAAADAPDDDASAGQATTSVSSAGRHGRAAGAATAPRTPRVPSAAATRSQDAPSARPAAARPAAEPAGDARSDATRTGGSKPRPAPGSGSVADGAPAGTPVVDRQLSDPSPTAPSAPTAPTIDSAVPVEVSAQPAAQATAPAAAAQQVATAGLPAAAAAAAATDSVAEVLGGALAPVQAFLEGIVLLVRRTFFNEAPTVTPVQLTGHTTGVITGTVGAVDPEGDPLTYSLTAAPVFGTVAIADDGSYVYTPGEDFGGTDAFTVAAADSGLHINLFNPFRPAYTLGNAVVTQGLTGPRIQFEFLYTGGALLWSPEARAALESTATILGSYFVVSAPVTVTYAVTGELSPLSGTLASASSDMISSRPGFFPTVVQEKIISGVDVNGTAPDGTITWNFGNPWAFGASVDNGQYDFQSVAMHELLHTFGFLSNVSAPGSNDGTGWTAFDGFLVDADGTAVIGTDFAWIAGYDSNLNGGDGGLFFGGPTATAAYGGPVPLFSPGPWQGGSSVSHLDDSSFYGRNEQLMNARVSQGKGIRTLSAVETAILTDLGYTMVPAPGASVTLLFGFFLLRRRRDR